MKTYINPNEGPSVSGPYSTAVEVSNISNLIFISGQLPVNPETNELNGETIEEQTHQVIKNISVILEQIGCTIEDVVKTTCFLKSMDDFEGFNKIYAQYFTNKPARSCIGNLQIPKGALCEVEIIASK